MTFLEWLHYQYRHIREVTFSIPNGSRRGIREGKRLKDEGMKAGVPDLFLAFPTARHSGMFIEFKKPGNKPTPSQIDMMQKLTATGYFCTICYSWLEASLQLKWYLDV